jgi:hypothetical protein
VADDTRKRITDTCELPLSGYIEKYA